MGRLVRLLSLACGVALAVGCASSPPLLRGTIIADPAINPDRVGRPSPVVVRVYELKSLGAFNGADFFSLFEKDQETLGSELVAREEYELRPAETKKYERQLQPDTKFIGVVAAFRDLENSRWRQAAPVPPQRSLTLTIGIGSGAVTVAVK
jgi:type VI secretion system protein VasD